jgi:hypothetical protein
MMLSGLMSRWMMPWLKACWSARAIWVTMLMARFSSSAPPRLRSSPTVGPSMYSMAK